MDISPQASRILHWLREQYLAAGHPNHHVWTFSPGDDDVPAFAELRAHRYIKRLTIGKPTSARWVLTDLGLRLLLRAPSSESAPTDATLQRETPSSSRYTLNIENSTIGAVTIGDHASARGTVRATGAKTASPPPLHADARNASALVESTSVLTGFSNTGILTIHAAATAVGLHDSRLALTAGLDRQLFAAMPTVSESGAQMLADLHALNDLARAGDRAPIETWLRAALALRGLHPQASVFQQALLVVCKDTEGVAAMPVAGDST